MSDCVKELLLSSSGDVVVEFAIATIHGFTILAREPELSPDQRAMINNWIHYLAGHARMVMRGEEVDERSAKAIADYFSRLPRSLSKNALDALE